MTENGIQCEPALAAAADIPQLLAAALSPLHLPYLLRLQIVGIMSGVLLGKEDKDRGVAAAWQGNPYCFTQYCFSILHPPS